MRQQEPTSKALSFSGPRWLAITIPDCLESKPAFVFCVTAPSVHYSLCCPAAKWWDGKKQPPPLCMTKQELQRSTDVFTIELLDMQQHHRLLFGDDVLKDLQIPMDLHRVQVEYELREKLILLRQHVLLASNNQSRLWDLLLRSAPSFSTLFRHALIAMGDGKPITRREAVTSLAGRVGFDASAYCRFWMCGSARLIARA